MSDKPVVMAVVPDRPMAIILRIKDISEIPKCQRIELAKVSGWQCVVKKGIFKVGELVIYFHIDSVLDEHDETFDFLKEGGYRVKSMKIRGVLSQGIIGPLEWLSKHEIDISTVKNFDDVTTILNVKKYVHPEEYLLFENTKENLRYPDYVKKTDEERLQNIPDVLSSILSRTIVISRKEDGTSATYVLKNGKFYICSRNFLLTNRTKENDHYYWISEKYKLDEKMKKLARELAIQGEIVGPEISHNRMGLDDLFFEVFNIWDITKQEYLEHYEVFRICNELELDQVPYVYIGNVNQDMEWYLHLAEEQKYGGNPGEGIVIKTIDGDPRVSFKVISNVYLLLYGL